MAHARKLLFAWRWAIVSEYGPKLASDRAVALVLGLHMRSDGLGAWPSQATIARETALTARAVRRSLQRLVQEHWLNQVTHKRGRGAYGSQYAARLPLKLANELGNQDFRSAFTGKRPAQKWPPANPDRGSASIRTPGPPNATERTLQEPAFKKVKVIEEKEVEEMRRAFGEIQ